jgi:hypothetical protein
MSDTKLTAPDTSPEAPGYAARASTVCACCGKSEDAHHAFDPIIRPPGCKCSVTDWRDKRNIPPVCSKYKKGDCGYYCKNCEHDPECHPA